jgi:hypothetical protein
LISGRGSVIDPAMEEATTPRANLTRINGNAAVLPPPKRVETRGRKRNPSPPPKALRYNLHVVLTKDEHAVLCALAKDLGPSDFVRQLLAGAAVMHGLLPAPRVTTAPAPCSSGVACSPLTSS